MGLFLLPLKHLNSKKGNTESRMGSTHIPYPQQQRIRGLVGWRRIRTRECGERGGARREQEATDPWMRTVISVEVGVREGRTGAAEWIKKNQSGFGIFFEALR